jgi:hypothetical protein
MTVSFRAVKPDRSFRAECGLLNFCWPFSISAMLRFLFFLLQFVSPAAGTGIKAHQDSAMLFHAVNIPAS